MMGIVNLNWYDARGKIGDYLTPEQYESGWPDSLAAGALTVLQRPRRADEKYGFWVLGRASNLLTAIHEGCNSGRIQAASNGDSFTIRAPEFATWLITQCETPSAQIQAWFDAVSTAQAAPVVTDQTEAVEPASDAPAIPKNQRPDLLTPLIEKAQSGETDPFSAAVIWPKLCDMAKRKTTPLIGKTESGLQWIDAKDNPQSLTKGALGDRLRRQKKAAIERGKPR